MTDIIDMANELRERLQDGTSKAGAKEKYPFSKLDVGQGFKIPDDKGVQSMRCLAYQRGRTMGRKFAVSVDGWVMRIK